MKITKILLSIGAVVFLLSATLPNMLRRGLDSPEPIGKYLNGKLPELTPGDGGGDWTLELAFPQLSFFLPLHMAQEPTTSRMMVAEMNGRIKYFNKDNPNQLLPFLDISERVFFEGESGLLNFAFHPKYGIDNRFFYVFYQYRAPGDSRYYTRISRFEVDETTQVAVPTSEQVLIQLYDRASNHNGGGLFFGLDGFLYIGFGDEGRANDAFDNAQFLNKRFYAGLLRIDVDQDPSKSHPIRRRLMKIDAQDNSFTDNYFIPNDNPFLDPNGGLLEEFYAIGLRNPHRVTLDAPTNTIWTGDVGQNQREEVDIIQKGHNYEWAYKEASLNGPKPRPATVFGTESGPIYEYGRTQGDRSIIGGYVYRGPTHRDLLGSYVFADFVSDRLWTLDYDAASGNTEVVELLRAADVDISAFATDADDELYVLGLANGGNIYKLARSGGGNPPAPRLLSQTGAFENLVDLEPAEGLMPYQVNQAFWSDGASKKRWMAIPNDGTHDSPEEKIEFSENEPWTFPKGTVMIKHFDFNTDQRDPKIKRKLETRFEVKGEDGQFYYLTYRWNAAGTDAVLLEDGEREDIAYIGKGGNPRTVSWYYPSRSDCQTCHKAAAGSVLGPNTRQLNRRAFFPKTKRMAHQLRTFNRLGMFSPRLDESQINGYLKVAALGDAQASLDAKARSYLDVNCSYCHRPGGGTSTDFDLRLTTALGDQGTVDVPGKNDLGIADAKLINPGKPWKSLLFRRAITSNESTSMPPLGKDLVDFRGKRILRDWINSLSRQNQVISLSEKKGLAATERPLFHIYPNPSSELLTLEGDEEIHTIRIVDTLGTLLLEKSNTKSIDISSLRPGTYMLIVNGKQKHRFMKY